jgi:hypothetical protein
LNVVDAISVRFHENSAPAFLSANTEDAVDPMIAGGGVFVPLDPEYHPNETESLSGGGASAGHPTQSGAVADVTEDASGTEGAAGETEHVKHGEEASVAGSNAMEDTVTNPAPVPEPEAPVVPDVSEINLEPPAADEPMAAAEQQQRRHPKRDRHPPTEWYRVNVPRLHTLQGLTDSPATYKEAVSRPDAAQWNQAIADELASLDSKGVYTPVNPPVGVNPLPSKLVLNIKRDEQGNLDKYKARLVAKGFRQVAGRDYDEVFAPTAQHVTLRVLLAIASCQELEVDQLDVKTAFLNGELSDQVYIKLPPELGSTVWRLHKALYGLKQAARAWFAKLRGSMLEHGFTPSQNDPCLFLRGQGAERVYVMAHVDDALVAGRRAAVNKAKRSMADMFEVKDMGAAQHFLGMTIKRGNDNGYSLTQPTYVDDILDRFGMVKCKPAVAPMPVGQKLSKDLRKSLPPTNHYQALVGSLLYLSVNTRPDISHAVGILSRFMSCPTDLHWDAAKHVLRYLKGTKHLGLCFTGGTRFESGGVCLRDVHGC